MTKYEFNGLISESGEWSEILIDGENIAAYCDDLNDKMVKLIYYISNSPIEKGKAVEQFLTSFYAGKCEADSTYCSGSSWTGIYSRNDILEVGGHNITSELQDKIGKYCYLIIETTP